MNQYIITGLILLALIGWGGYEHTRFLNERLAYSDFRETSAAKVLKQKEEHDEQVANALAARDDALNRLRDNEIRSRAIRANITPQGGDRLCFHRTAFDTALQQFLGNIEILIAEGDLSLINLQATLAAWPK